MTVTDVTFNIGCDTELVKALTDQVDGFISAQVFDVVVKTTEDTQSQIT